MHVTFRKLHSNKQITTHADINTSLVAQMLIKTLILFLIGADFSDTLMDRMVRPALTLAA